MDQLRDAMEALRRIEELDPRYKALADRLSSAFYESEELGIELRDVLESENFDPERSEARAGASGSDSPPGAPLRHAGGRAGCAP